MIEVGVTYWRRDGELAKCWHQPSRGLYRVSAGSKSYCVKADGRAHSHSRKNDLVGPASEPFPELVEPPAVTKLEL